MSRRVAYLLKKFPRLSETFIVGEILQQEALGADLVVLSRRAPDPEPRHPALARLRAPVEVLPGSSNALDPWSELFVQNTDAVRFERLAGVVRAMQPHGLAKFPRLMAEALHLLRRTKDLGVEHVHVHFATDSAIVAMLLHELGGPTYSITTHAKDIYRSTVDRNLLSRVIGNSKFTVTVCDANLEHLRGMLTPKAGKKVRRLYNGIDLDYFSYRPGPRDERHLISVGRLVPKKGFDVLVEAVSRLRDRSIRCTIVGEGEEREALQALIRERGLEDRVTLEGALDPDAVRDLLGTATIFCLPCVIGPDGNRDALPTVLIEAQARGLPVVSTPVTGIPEILAGGRAGVLVPERDPQTTASALDALFEDRSHRERLAGSARDHAEHHFDGRDAARTLFSWMNDLVPTPARG